MPKGQGFIQGHLSVSWGNQKSSQLRDLVLDDPNNIQGSWAHLPSLRAPIPQPLGQPLTTTPLALCAQVGALVYYIRCKSTSEFRVREKREGSSLGLPAVNELIWGEGSSENEDSLPRVTRVLRRARPMSAFYVALSLPGPGARRQVYEIKAQCPINNLAAYCKKTYMQYNSYYLQQPDVYRHCKCTPLSSACIHLMWGLEPKEEEKKSVTSTLSPRAAVTTGLRMKKTLPRTHYSGLCWQSFPTNRLLPSLLRSLLTVAVCACRKNLKAPPDQLFIENLVFFSQGCLLWSKAGSRFWLLWRHKQLVCGCRFKPKYINVTSRTTRVLAEVLMRQKLAVIDW